MENITKEFSLSWDSLEMQKFCVSITSRKKKKKLESRKKESDRKKNELKKKNENKN